MKKFLSGFIAAVLLLAFACQTATAAGKLTVVQEKFVVLPFIDYHAGYIYAQVSNTGDKPVEFAGGLLELFDGEGNSIESTNYLGCYPPVLNAGETAYLSAYQGVEGAVDEKFIDDYSLTVTGKGSKDTQKIDLKATNAKYQAIDEGYWTYTYISADIENNANDTYFDFFVVFALKDDQGNLMYVTQCNPSYVGIKPGTTLEIRVSVDSGMLEYFEANKIVPSAVEALAYVIVN